MGIQVFHGDCRDVLRTLGEDSIEAVVTDPPYGLSKEPDAAEVLRHWLVGDDYAHKGQGFMSKSWDSFVPGPVTWKEVIRVMKPGAYLLCFAGTRTQDLMGVSLRLAGFEIRDCIRYEQGREAWPGYIFGTGFPKSLDIGKAIDKRGGNAHLTGQIGDALRSARLSRGMTIGECDRVFCGGTTNWTWFEGRPAGQRAPTSETFRRIVAAWPEMAEWANAVDEVEREILGKKAVGVKDGAAGGSHSYGYTAETVDITAPATEAAKKWNGWGTQLKPAHEPILLARKPLSESTVAANVLKHGVGGLNIDKCRIPAARRPLRIGRGDKEVGTEGYGSISGGGQATGTTNIGRFPANVILEASEEIESSFSVFGERKSGGVTHQPRRSGSSGFNPERDTGTHVQRDPDTATASRFFQRCEPDPETTRFYYSSKAGKQDRQGTAHPTTKPTSLCKYLVRLVCPPGGTVLDPFAGSGTTGVAALREGFSAILIEREAEYVEMIHHRLAQEEKKAPEQPSDDPQMEMGV